MRCPFRLPRRFACATATGALSAQTAQRGVGVDLAGVDKAARPGDGFDQYANGAWRASTPIPADRTNIGTFLTTAMLVEQRNNEIITGAARANPAAGTNERRIADYYAAYLDTATINRRGTEPLQPHLAADRRHLEPTGHSQRPSAPSMRADVDPLNATNFFTENLFGVFVAQGLQQPDRNRAYLLQGGLGLPDRDYYISDTPAIVRVREAYRAYVGQMLAADGHGQCRGARPADLRSRNPHRPRPCRRRPRRRMRIASRPGAAPSLPPAPPVWIGTRSSRPPSFPARTRSSPGIAEPIAGIAALVGTEPIEVWRDWLAFHTASRFAAVLPQAYDDLRFGFYGRTLGGQQQQRPRERRAIQATSNALIDAMGQIYVAATLSRLRRADVQTMVRNIANAFDRRLQGATWLAPATLAEARRKVETVRVGIGYPDRWRDYSRLEIRADDAFGNAWRAQEQEYRHQLSKLGQPVDRNEWWLGAHTVNAVNLPLQNAMNFPAGILEPPFYDRTADPAYNYGAIGSVIGHEISHSFDNLGADVRRRGAAAQLVDGGTLPISARRARPWSGSTTPIGPSPISPSTANSPWARISPTSPASPPLMTPIMRR